MQNVFTSEGGNVQMFSNFIKMLVKNDQMFAKIHQNHPKTPLKCPKMAVFCTFFDQFCIYGGEWGVFRRKFGGILQIWTDMGHFGRKFTQKSHTNPKYGTIWVILDGNSPQIRKYTTGGVNLDVKSCNLCDFCGFCREKHCFSHYLCYISPPNPPKSYQKSSKKVSKLKAI